jgi:hypothetical protein
MRSRNTRARRNGTKPASTPAACGFVPPPSTRLTTSSSIGIVPPRAHQRAPHSSAVSANAHAITSFLCALLWSSSSGVAAVASTTAGSALVFGHQRRVIAAPPRRNSANTIVLTHSVSRSDPLMRITSASSSS